MKGFIYYEVTLVVCGWEILDPICIVLARINSNCNYGNPWTWNKAKASEREPE